MGARIGDPRRPVVVLTDRDRLLDNLDTLAVAGLHGEAVRLVAFDAPAKFGDWRRLSAAFGVVCEAREFGGEPAVEVLKTAASGTALGLSIVVAPVFTK